MRGGHRQTVRLREHGELLIILFRWAELLCELFRAQVTAVIGAVLVVELVGRSRKIFLCSLRLGGLKGLTALDGPPLYLGQAPPPPPPTTVESVFFAVPLP